MSVALGTGYVSASAGLIIAPKDNFRSRLPLPGEQALSFDFLPLETQPARGLGCRANALSGSSLLLSIF